MQPLSSSDRLRLTRGAGRPQLRRQAVQAFDRVEVAQHRVGVLMLVIDEGGKVALCVEHEASTILVSLYSCVYHGCLLQAITSHALNRLDEEVRTTI